MGPASWLDLIFAAPQAGAGIPLHIISISWGIVNFFMRCAELCGLDTFGRLKVYLQIKMVQRWKNGAKKLYAMDNIGCVLGGGKGNIAKRHRVDGTEYKCKPKADKNRCLSDSEIF